MRKLLHLDKRRATYVLSDEQQGGTAASYEIFDEGTMICIKFYPLFWEGTPDEQLQVVVHEHIHAVTNGIAQVWNKYCRYIPKAQRKCMLNALILADENATCHMEAVICDLIRKHPRWKNLYTESQTNAKSSEFLTETLSK